MGPFCISSVPPFQVSLDLNAPKETDIHGANGYGTGETIFLCVNELKRLFTRLPMAPATETGAALRRLRGRQQAVHRRVNMKRYK